MRKEIVIATCLLSSHLVADDNWCLNRSLFLSGEFGYQRRQEGSSRTLVERGGIKVVRADDLVDDMEWEYAFRVSAIYSGSECSSLEAQYTYYLPWCASETVTGGGVALPFDDNFFTFDYFNADQAYVKYKSWLENGEINYWLHVTPQRADFFAFAWLFGFRFIYLKEKLLMQFTKRGDTSDYHIKTLNLLYGPQLGAVLEYNPNCSFTWAFEVKGAGFLNDAQNKTLLQDDNNFFTLRDYTKKRWTNSWLIEGYAKLTYHWTSFLSIYASYEGYLVTGLALAPAQIDTSSSNKPIIRERGQILIDGLFVGATWSF